MERHGRKKDRFRAGEEWYFYEDNGRMFNLATKKYVDVKIVRPIGLVYSLPIDSLNAMLNPGIPLIPGDIINNIPVKDGLQDPRRAQGEVIFFGDVELVLIKKAGAYL